METKNSNGCVVSLLNHDDDDACSQYSDYSRHHESLRKLSNPSPTPSSQLSLSPSVPSLDRSDSASEARSMQSPSPLTPTMSQEHLPFSMPPSGKQYQQQMPQYYPYPQYQPQPPQTPSSASSKNAAAAAGSAGKKNNYPCPVARMYGCNDFFTTSGHAARHAKKHTGKKDAVCPECNKAFTRKDNMEQHRRTHSGVRNPNGVATSGSKVEERRRSKKTHGHSHSLSHAKAGEQTPQQQLFVRVPQQVQVQPVLTPGMENVDPMLRDMQAQQTPSPYQFQYAQYAQQRPALSRSSAYQHVSYSQYPAADSPRLSGALDALAIAAENQRP